MIRRVSAEKTSTTPTPETAAWESVLKKQNSFLWFLGNGGKEKDSQVTMQYSQEKLDAVIDGFDEFQSADGENAPASAYITFQNNEFEIVDAVMGEEWILPLQNSASKTR